jgi:hypothetical protein
MKMSDFGVTLYSEPDFKGKSCFVRPFSKTYSLAATGLDKIASVKVTNLESKQTNDPFAQPCFVRLYLNKPERELDSGSDEGTGWTDVHEDTADTGKFASAGWLSAQVQSLGGVGVAPLTFGEDPGREIHETLPS